MSARVRAVVFAYHDVGVRGLRTLLAHGVCVPLVLTHEDAAGECIWFDSVARHAAWHGIRVRTPADPNAPEVIAEVAAARPDFLFSFYYRRLLGAALLALPPRGAYNLHGSLLPKYRGRVPVNWAVLHGERQTGATLHAMTAEPDAGPIVAREAVPILPDDTAVEVFRKVTVAAELLLDRTLPALLAGDAPHTPQDAAAATRFGRRSARDGAIDWRRGALAAHNLVRAVAPPYPGAFSRAAGMPLAIWRSLPGAVELAAEAPQLRWQDGVVHALCRDGSLQLLEFQLGAHIASAGAFYREFGERALPLEPCLECP
ncbi:MAG TPA: formyltransferase [Steroidobacteraceae bacterium]|nr:formyltransferase [Steroidobacteraceae bacterium]